MLTLTVNGEKEQIKDVDTVEKLLLDRDIDPEVVTVKLNDKILDRDDFSETRIADGDQLEFVFFMGGGN